MRRIRFTLVALLVTVGTSLAQTTEKPTHIPTPRAPGSPFGTDWAKPNPSSNGFIYRDPRLVDPNRANKAGSARCPAPMLYDPTTNRCR